MLCGVSSFAGTAPTLSMHQARRAGRGCCYARFPWGSGTSQIPENRFKELRSIRARS
jgi:hypothetical protein